MGCRRGELYWIDFSPPQGSELAGPHPALVVQNDRGNESSPTTVVVGLSSAELQRPYPFTVPLAAGEAGLKKAGFVNCAQLLTVDQRQLVDFIGSLSPERMAEVDVALRYELNLE
jgi:mRNA interferase MazF